MSESAAETGARASQIRSEKSMDPRAVRTRQALRDAFLELLATTPFAQITPRHIAAQAGLASATFYRHHASKEEMLDDIASDEMNALFTGAMEVLDSSGARASTRFLCDHIDARRTLWMALLNGGASGILRTELVAHCQEIAASRPVNGARLPTELAIAVSTSATLEIIAWWLRQKERLSAEKVADLLMDLVLDPIQAASQARNWSD